MKVAARVDVQNIAGGPRQLRDFRRDLVRREGVLMVGVRSGYDVSGSIGGCELHHGNGLLERLGAVVERGKNMAVDIDHLAFMLHHAPRAEETPWFRLKDPR